jgi:hypothetical protein
VFFLKIILGTKFFFVILIKRSRRQIIDFILIQYKRKFLIIKATNRGHDFSPIDKTSSQRLCLPERFCIENEVTRISESESNQNI